MATMTVSTTDRRDSKALALFAACDTWQTGRTKNGRSFFAIPGSEPDLFHMTDTRNCSCPDRRERLEVCKHMRAVRLWTAAFKTGTVAPKRAAVATAQDDRAVLLPAGAAYLAAQTTSAADPHAECEATDAGAVLAKLQADQAEHVRTMRLLGYTPDEYLDNAVYAQGAEHIARLTACTRELVPA